MGLKATNEATNMHRLDRVGVDDLLVRLSLLLPVGSLVNELHLLEDCRFSRFSRSEEQHFAVHIFVSVVRYCLRKDEAYISFLRESKSARFARKKHFDRKERGGKGGEG